jgi:hypothetical protein
MIRTNPEIQRNIWLEFSLHRLIAMPLVLGLIFFIASRANPDNVPATYIGVSNFLFFMIVKIWGGYKAANSVIEEVNDHTWDFQKLSALSPWSLTIGKLFGSTSYAWYGGFILFVVFAMSITNLPLAHNAGWQIALFLLGGLVVQAGALLASLVGVSANEDGRRRKLRPLSFLVFGLIVGGFGQQFNALLYMASSVATKQDLPPIHWYGGMYDHFAFVTCASAILLAWLIGGVYWQMRAQMKMKTGPWLWAAFLIFWGYFMSGFGYPPLADAAPAKLPAFADALTSFGNSVSPVRAFILAIVGLYFIAFNESWTGVRYRRLADAWKVHNFKKCLELCPRWLVTYIICIFFALGAPIPFSTDLMPPFTLLFFAARDIAVLHFFKLSPNNRRALQATAFYLVVLYGLIPFLLSILHMTTAMVYFVPAFFYPTQADISASMLAGALQAALAILFALYQWQRHWKAA